MAAPVSPTPRPSQLGLNLRLSCGTWTLSFDATPVERVLLLDEAPGAPTGATGSALLGPLQLGNRIYAAFDLGALLEQPTTPAAWILLGLRRGPQRLPLALRTGSVQRVTHQLDVTCPLPAGITRKRPGVLRRGFVLRDARGPAVGFELDLTRLLTGSELDAAFAALADLPSSRHPVNAT